MGGCFPWAVVVVVVVVLCCLFSLGGGRGCGCFPWAVDRISRICKTRLGITLAGKLLFCTSRYFVENSRYKIGVKLIQG